MQSFQQNVQRAKTIKNHATSMNQHEKKHKKVKKQNKKHMNLSCNKTVTFE